VRILPVGNRRLKHKVALSAKEKDKVALSAIRVIGEASCPKAHQKARAEHSSTSTLPTEPVWQPTGDSILKHKVALSATLCFKSSSHNTCDLKDILAGHKAYFGHFSARRRSVREAGHTEKWVTLLFQ
jgi:hypothetical protein